VPKYYTNCGTGTVKKCGLSTLVPFYIRDTFTNLLNESEDVYTADEEKFPPGNYVYFNVRAGRKAMKEKGEMVTGDMPDLKKKECGFDGHDDMRRLSEEG
jgi:hypothetical protein